MSVTDLWGQGFSEPDAGSDLAGLKTRAELDGDEWVVTGQKIWTTFGMYADWLYVLCRTDPGSTRHKGISMLMIPAHQPGVDIRPIRNIADRTEFAEVFLDGARTAVGNVVGAPGNGWAIVMGTLGNERAGATVLPFQASFAREMVALRELVAARRLAGDPVLRDRLARAWSGLRIMQLNNARLLTSVLQGHHPGAESSIGKLFWANWHRDFGELMIDVLGSDAIASESPVLHDRMVHSFLNSRAETIYGGSNEIQRNIIGERVLGLPR
jgi:alkylation response protein AidB-like acyl-CoA dehydrogenase